MSSTPFFCGHGRESRRVRSRRGRVIEIIVIRMWAFTIMLAALLSLLLLGVDISTASAVVVLIGGAAVQMSAHAAGRRSLPVTAQ